jgi:hypothetical protein
MEQGVLGMARMTGTSDGDDDLGGGDEVGDFADDVFDDLRLDADDDDVGGLDGVGIAGADDDIEFGGERFSAFFMGDGCAGGGGREQAVFEQGLEDDAAHFSSAEEGDAFVGESVCHGRPLLCGAGAAVVQAVVGRWSLAARELKGPLEKYSFALSGLFNFRLCTHGLRRGLLFLCRFAARIPSTAIF